MTLPAHFLYLLDQLAAALRRESLPRDEHGVCSLVVDGILPLNLGTAAEGRDIVLFAPLGKVPPAQRALLLGRMLSANGAGASPYVLGLAQDDGDQALISARRPLDGLTIQDLEQWAGAFVDTALGWSKVLQAGSGSPGGSAGNGEGPSSTPPADPGAWLRA